MVGEPVLCIVLPSSGKGGPFRSVPSGAKCWEMLNEINGIAYPAE